jgi:hypothetical protein
MREPMPSVDFNFLEAIEVELSDKAFVFLMAEIQWNNFFFHFFKAENINHGPCFIPAYDFRVLGILR